MMIDWKKAKKLLGILAAAYWVFVLLIYLVAGQQFRYAEVGSDPLSASVTVGEIVDGMEICQTVDVPAEKMTSVSLMTSTFGRTNAGTMTLTFEDRAGTVVCVQQADISAFADGGYTQIPLDQPIMDREGEKLTLTLTTQGCMPGNAVTVYAGNTVTAGRFDIVQTISEEDRYTVNGQQGVGKLCLKAVGIKALDFYKTYWIIVAAAFAGVSALCMRWWKMARQNKNNPLYAVLVLCMRYSFLVKQLVQRDFKTKYKRSVLGMAWSFLNPLMTMCVQYIVFSRLFRSDIPNYSVYLLTGIVFMNFFNEAVSMGMTSITGNASLIKKVYMPKYIYPVARVISSLVNFLIALIPLMLVMVLSGIWPRPALLLLLFDIICLVGFIAGMSLLLTTAMTFFHDTQFLWGVVSMMWMYLTPVFYPESIIPEKLLTLYHMNPMYQYVTFARICIIDGVSPAPTAYLWCILSSAVVFVLGAVVFKKNQDKFVLHL